MQFLDKHNQQPGDEAAINNRADNKTMIKVVPVPTAMSKPLKISRLLEEKIEILRNEVADIMASGMSSTSRMKMLV
jgi:hypothetical protein